MSEKEKKSDLFDAVGNPTKPGDDVNQSRTPAHTQSHLAWLRTRMTLENTLAAWVRTATSLIAFGFAIVQFFGPVNQAQGIVAPKGQYLAHYVGLLLIGIGTLTTGIAISGYLRFLKYLQGDAFHGIAGIPGMHPRYPDPALVVAIFVCLIGLLAFFAILAGTELPWPGRS